MILSPRASSGVQPKTRVVDGLAYRTVAEASSTRMASGLCSTSAWKSFGFTGFCLVVRDRASRSFNGQQGDVVVGRDFAAPVLDCPQQQGSTLRQGLSPALLDLVEQALHAEPGLVLVAGFMEAVRIK